MSDGRGTTILAAHVGTPVASILKSFTIADSLNLLQPLMTIRGQVPPRRIQIRPP